MKSERILLLLAFVMCFSVAHSQPQASDTAIELDIRLLRGQNFYKTGGSSLFALAGGKQILSAGSTILSSFDGQLIIAASDATTEFRLKEETSLSFLQNDACEIRKGTTGFHVFSGILNVSTPHLKIEATEGIFVVKVNSVLTRVAVVKGQIRLWQGNSLEKTTLPAGNEIAAAQGRLAEVYACSDELRYTWYWKSPEEEPSLKID